MNQILHYRLAWMAAHPYEPLHIANERLVIKVPVGVAKALAHAVTRHVSGDHVELVLDVEREDLAEPAIGAALPEGSGDEG